VLVLLMGGINEDAVEIASDGMIQIPNFIKISSDIQKFLWRCTCKYTDTHRHHGHFIILLLLFLNKEIRLKMHNAKLCLLELRRR
jgi:hypothetical protein